MTLRSNVMELEDVPPLYFFICYCPVCGTHEVLLTTVEYPYPESSVAVPLCVPFR